MSEKSTKLKVEGLPQDTTVSQLTVLLSNKRRQGGGPIENIELTAIVTFEQSDAVDIILSRGNTVQLNDVTVKVSRYFDPDNTQSSMKRSRTRSKGNISVVDEQEDLSDSEDSTEKVKMKPNKSLKETEKNKKTAGVKKQHSVPDEEAKPRSKMSKTYSQASDDEHINSSDENKSLPRESKNKSQKAVKDKTKNKSSMLLKAFSSAKENVAQKPKVSKHPISQDELYDTESESEKRNNRKHKSLKDFSAKKKSSAGKKTTSDSHGDSQFYRKRSTANSRAINDDESSNESTESESSPERKINRSHKKSPKKTKSSVVNKVTHDSENSEEEQIEEPEKPRRTTIKATVSDITKTKDFYVMYFEDPHISQGQFYEESFLLDGLNRNLYVTFCDSKAAVATVSFKHTAESNLRKVELAKEEDFNTIMNLISVHGYAFSTAEQKRELKQTIEKISEMEVIDIIQQDEPRSAIIAFNPDSCQDISAVTWKPVYFGTTRLIVAPVFQTNSIKVTGLYQSSSDDTLKRYMSNTKRSGGGEITLFQWLSKTEACISFKEKESVDGVTRKVHNLEGAELHAIEYHHCLTTEVYKKQVEALMEQFMNNTEALAPEPRKEKNTTESKVENETMLVDLTMEQELELEEKDIIMLEKTHFHKDLEKKTMPLQIFLNTEKMCAIIKGNDRCNIDQAQVGLLKKVRDFNNIDITSSFSPEQLQLLNKEEVQNNINSTYLEMNYHAHFRCSNGTVSIYHVKEVSSNVLKEVAISQVTTRKKPLDKDMALILQSEKGRKFLADICGIHDGVKVSSCVKLEDNCLHIVSPAKQLDIVLKAIDHFLEENKSYEKVIPFSSGKQKFAHKCLSQDLAQIIDSLIPLGAKIVDHAEKYTVQGLKDGVMVGEKKLSQLSETILVQEITLKYFGIAEFLQTAEGESLLGRVENTQPCVILQSELSSGQGNTATFRGDSLQRVMTDVSELANLKIYADSPKNIASANKTLNDLVKAAFKEETDNDEKLKRLDKNQVRQLEDEGRKNHVKVTVSIEQGLITMSSFDRDGIIIVLKLLKTQLIAAVEDHHKILHQPVKSAIIWQFEQEKWRDFEPLLNSELESEYKKKATQHTITDAKDHTYPIDFSAMKEFPLNSAGKIRGYRHNIRRYDRTREGEPVPKARERMKDSENLKLVTLQAGSPEFKAAEQRFIQGGANVPIKKIQRIQNKSLYQKFKAKKREMDHRNPKGHENEQRLFHGTDAASVTAIIENGFNRCYCGQNATAYGNGVYFAVQSSYSLNYAKPSAQGERFMYIARVLTGQSTPSTSGMSYLPNKPGTNIPYDSGTGGNIFIIFHDTQAYPQYLITF